MLTAKTAKKRSLTSSRIQSTSTEAKEPDPELATQKYEKLRNKLLSVLVLQANDKLKSLEQPAPVNDSFWSQLESVLSRHELQIDRITKQAMELKSNLSVSLMSATETHSERMNRATEKLESIQKQIADLTYRIENDQTEALKQREIKIKSDTNTADAEIKIVTTKVEKIRTRTNKLKDRLKNARQTIEDKGSTMQQRKEQTKINTDKVAEEINATKQEIATADRELQELDQRETLVRDLYESLKQPIPSINRIFSQE